MKPIIFGKAEKERRKQWMNKDNRPKFEHEEESREDQINAVLVDRGFLKLKFLVDD